MEVVSIGTVINSDEIEKLKQYRDHLTNALIELRNREGELHLQHWFLLNKLLERFEIDKRDAEAWANDVRSREAAA